jgi:hypothetical protein
MPQRLRFARGDLFVPATSNPPKAITMTNAPLIARLDHHVHDAAEALDLASTALIRAQELADQDATGTGPARLAEATVVLQGNLRMLADMLTAPTHHLITVPASEP